MLACFLIFGASAFADDTGMQPITINGAGSAGRGCVKHNTRIIKKKPCFERPEPTPEVTNVGEDVVAIISNPSVEYTTTPHAVMKVAKFMHKTGAIKSLPGKWQDLFFPNLHNDPGS